VAKKQSNRPTKKPTARGRVKAWGYTINGVLQPRTFTERRHAVSVCRYWCDVGHVFVKHEGFVPVPVTITPLTRKARP
jgi:hypothetical protein